MNHPSPMTQPNGMPVAGRYRLDPGRSSVTLRTRHLFGLGAVSGTMRIVSAEISADPAVPQATVIAVLDAASFSTGNRSRDRDVRSPRFLDAGNHPHITFQAEALSQASGRWVLGGELTVRGVSRLVTLAIGPTEAAGPDGNGFRARATTRIDRYAFGLTAAKGMAARFLDIDVTAVAEPQQQAPRQR